MDECTANVDAGTDKLIQQSVRKQFAEATVLCIAHRLHSIIDYDRVLVRALHAIPRICEPVLTFPLHAPIESPTALPAPCPNPRPNPPLPFARPGPSPPAGPRRRSTGGV